MRLIHLLTFLTMFLAGCGFFVDEEVEAAVKTGNPSECTKFEEMSRADSCFSKMAEKKDSTELCRRVTKESRKANCVINIAENKADINICQQLKGDKDICYNRVAQKTQKVSQCKLIKSISNSERCIENIAVSTGSPDLCKEVEIGRSKCWFRMAKEFGVEFCNEISTPESHEICVRGSAKTVKECDDYAVTIKMPSIKDNCYYGVAIRAQDISVCGKMTFELGMRDGCYLSIAQRTKKWESCMYIIHSERQGNCLEFIAGSLKSPDICSNIKDPARAQACTKKIA